tara:strand:- start:74 stop:370 length:297 start_codon:yes stop_codon:yes gene_type:complete
MTKYKLLNGVKVQLTTEEETELDNFYANNNTFEKQIAKLRIQRNSLLIETDYIVTKNLEAGTDIPADWKTYRQSLRDLTNGLTTVEEVNAVVFPTKPE